MNGQIAINGKLPEADDLDQRLGTTFSCVYPDNKEFPHLLMPGNDIKLGFVSFKRAKGIGPLKNFKHKLSGQYKDPVSVNKKFFKENPHLV
jgi:hypothetical protein